MNGLFTEQKQLLICHMASTIMAGQLAYNAGLSNDSQEKQLKLTKECVSLALNIFSYVDGTEIPPKIK